MGKINIDKEKTKMFNFMMAFRKYRKLLDYAEKKRNQTIDIGDNLIASWNKNDRQTAEIKKLKNKIKEYENMFKSAKPLNKESKGKLQKEMPKIPSKNKNESNK